MDIKDFYLGYSEDFCYFKAKLDLLETLLKSVFPSFKNNSVKILDIGPGIGSEVFLLSKYGNVIVIDVNFEVVNRLKDLGFQSSREDVCKLPYKSEEFDIVVAMDVFEHIDSDYLAIKEIYRVLKNNGWLIFSVPAYKFLYSAYDTNLGHFRRYNKKELISLLSKFFYKRIHFWNSIFFLPIIIIRVINENKTISKQIKISSFINRIIYKILRFENFLIENKFSFPFGISIVGMCKKVE